MGENDLRERILSCDDTQKELVTVPEWGVDLEVRSITGKQRNEVYEGTTNSQGKVDLTAVYANLLVASVYDPNTGNQVFNKKDKDKLMDKSGSAIERLLDVAQRLGGIGGKAIEEAEKN